MAKTISFTKEGFEKLQKQHKKLTEDRVEAVKHLQLARDMGDRSENGYYIASRQKLTAIDRQLRHLNNLLKYGKVVEKNTSGVVDIGSLVTVTVNSNTYTYTIVGGWESDVMNGKISQYSPIGKALMRTKKGDRVVVHAPNGQQVYEVTQVE